jgi:phytoene dehydrogenase-like protein
MTPLLESLAAEPFAPQEEPPPRMRASDADREAVVRTLLDAIARGLLTLSEGDERVAAAYAARFLDELPRLTADLPPAPASDPVAPGWRALGLLAWLQVRTAVAGLWRTVRRLVSARPRIAVALVALLALLSLMAATAGTAGAGSGHGGHDGYGYHDHDRYGHHHHDHDDYDYDDDYYDD